MLPTLRKQIAHFQNEIVKLRGVCETLGAAIADPKIDELEAQMRLLIETQGGAFVAGDVNAGDDFVGRDQTVSAKMDDLATGGDTTLISRKLSLG
jgi:hypothetical protein